MNSFYQIVLFLLGSSIASFLYATSVRLPKKNESILYPSRCRDCNKNLKWINLIPIFSWILQQGRCGCSKQNKLSKNYLLAEISLGFIFVVIGHFSQAPMTLAWLTFASLMFFFFLTDYLYQLLHFPTLIIGILLGILVSVYDNNVYQNLIGGVLGFIIIFGINFIFLKLKNKQGFGDGDAYLLAMIGCWLGPIIMFQTLILSSWLGIFFVGMYYLIKHKKITKLPLAVLLAIALTLLILFKCLQ